MNPLLGDLNLEISMQIREQLPTPISEGGGVEWRKGIERGVGLPRTPDAGPLQWGHPSAHALGLPRTPLSMLSGVGSDRLISTTHRQRTIRRDKKLGSP